LEQWRDQELRGRNLPDHLFEHIVTMAASMPPTVMIV